MEKLFDKVKEKVKEGVEELFDDLGGSHHDQGQQVKVDSGNRYSSFAPQSSGHAKWYVDGASYFWAVSMALEGDASPNPFLSKASSADALNRGPGKHLHLGLVAEPRAPPPSSGCSQ